MKITPRGPRKFYATKPMDDHPGLGCGVLKQRKTGDRSSSRPCQAANNRSQRPALGAVRPVLYIVESGPTNKAQRVPIEVTAARHSAPRPVQPALETQSNGTRVGYVLCE